MLSIKLPSLLEVDGVLGSHAIQGGGCFVERAGDAGCQSTKHFLVAKALAVDAGQFANACIEKKLR